jgi:hypothetical protein
MRGTTAFLLLVGQTICSIALAIRSTSPEPPEWLPPGPESQTITRRILAKEQLARDLIAGGRSLWETAALFRELNRLTPRALEPPALSSSPAPGAEERRLVQQVIAYVRMESHAEPDGGKAVVGRLEAEVASERAKHGMIRLPQRATLVPVQELLDRRRSHRPKYPPDPGQKS